MCNGRLRQQRSAQRGLTLIELVIGVVIASITLSIAVPTFDHVMAQNRRAVTANRLLAALVTARETAISRNTPVTFCAGNPSEGCHGDWRLHEWMVFVDADHDGQVDAGEFVKTVDSLSSSVRVGISGNGPFRHAVIFEPSGAAQTPSGAFAAGRLRICASKPMQDEATDLVLIGSGRIEPESRDFPDGCRAI
ncbi:GspH/FimT family pseudopilin [Solimonas terrae]|uniref:Type II secretion system protein H n=1 Tax=Solimonas terrae TaxID=1396819 RepID=A0A6M2BWJ0_9GAMM|nr:GspH/FimT family pseudopilin [Solimonas terrae]NGY06277.1 prepilin-type N-terminal cleavage/methylation domain-containing protein [Solimonas terrae]